MNQNCLNPMASNHDGIACVAFQLWEKAGRPEGRDLEFWQGAETRLRATQKPSAAKLENVAVKPFSAKRELF
jgi:Protein of unknown function (DUF2934)